MNPIAHPSLILVLALAALFAIGYVEGGLLYAILFPVVVAGVTALMNIVFMAFE